MRVPIRKGTRQFDDDDAQYFLTPEGEKKLQQTLTYLEAEQPKVAEEKLRAAALGDRSENAEYKDAKARLSSIQSRINSIKDRLKRAVIIEKKTNDGVVDIGSTVTIESQDEKKSRQTYEIVGQFETKPGQGRISNRSPLGMALIGKQKDDEVTIKAPKGETRYLIIKIE